MRSATLLNVARENAAAFLFNLVATNVPADVQDAAQTEVAVTPSEPGGLPLVPHAAYTEHTIYANGPRVPDIRIGDQLIDLSDIDPQTYLPSTYIVMLVRRWTWHLEIAARKPAIPFNIGAVNLALLASYNQQATWLQRITDQTTGAAPGPGFEPYRQQEVSMGDGTFGDGWLTQSGGFGGGFLQSVRNAYQPPATVTVGINDAYRIEEMSPQGLVFYDTAVVIFVPPVSLSKGDILALQDGSANPKRYVVADEVTTERIYGVPVLTIAKLETPEPNSIIYQVPLT